MNSGPNDFSVSALPTCHLRSPRLLSTYHLYWDVMSAHEMGLSAKLISNLALEWLKLAIIVFLIPISGFLYIKIRRKKKIL